MQPILVSSNPDYTLEQIDAMALRDIDREELVRLMISYGIETMKVMGDDHQVVVWFRAEDVAPFESKYLSNKMITVDWRMVVASFDWWRNAIVLWKSKIRFEESRMRSKTDA